MTTESRKAVDDDGEGGVATSRRPADPRARGRHFSMAVVNFWLDALLLALLTGYGWVLAVLRFVFPAPSSAAGWRLWGWNFDQWWDFQFDLVCAFAVGVLVHLMLHWNWVCSVVANQMLGTRRRPDDTAQTIYGVGTLIVVLHVIGFGVIAALYCVHRPGH